MLQLSPDPPCVNSFGNDLTIILRLLQRFVPNLLQTKLKFGVIHIHTLFSCNIQFHSLCFM